MENVITGKVVKVNDEFTVVINKGFADGVERGNKFLIYQLGEEIIDPDTGESLGQLELVCGEGAVAHIQKKLTTLTSSLERISKTKTIVKRNGFSSFWGGETEEIYDPKTVKEPFKDVDIGFLVRQIR